MLKKIDIKFLLGAVACFTVATMIIKGTSGIVFADPINEMFTFALVCVGGLVFLAATKK